MIEMIDIGMADAVAYRIEGKITEEDMKTILAIFKEKIEKNQKLIVYQEVVSIGGAEFDAMMEKLKFLFEFGLSHFSRIAVITHKKWLHTRCSSFLNLTAKQSSIRIRLLFSGSVPKMGMTSFEEKYGCSYVL